jgi:hypothetical protein
MAEERRRSRSHGRREQFYWCRHREGDETVWQVGQTVKGQEESVAEARAFIQIGLTRSVALGLRKAEALHIDL